MWSKVKSLVIPSYFLFWLVYFAFFWSGAFRFDKFGNLLAAHVNLWGDWAAHFTMGSALGYRQLFLTSSPFLLGERFSYPFITNFLSGLLIRFQVPFLLSFVIPSFCFSVLLIGALFYFFKTIFQSRKIALIASLIFLLNGGLGFLFFFHDVSTSLQPWETFLNPPHEYTRIDEQGIKWLSVIDSMIIPQRAFTMGFPLSLIALTLIYQHFFLKKTPKSRSLKSRYWRLLVAIVILGFMPLIHTHSFLACGIILTFWCLAGLIQLPKLWRENLKDWVFLAGGIAAFAAPLYAFFFMNRVSHFIQWYPGWLAKEFEMNWLLFWLKNWALTPVLAVVGYVTLVSRSTHKFKTILLFLPFILLFILPNLFLFQPFSWDNTKLFVWASLGFAGLIGYLFTTKFTTLMNKSAIILLFLITILSGSIDAYRILRLDLHSYVMYSAQEMGLSEWVKKETSVGAVWLTGIQHNHWLFNLTGRQALMTYPGWLWTHGYDYYPTENTMRYLYRHPEDLTAFTKNQIEYVVIGPYEKTELSAQGSRFAEYHQLIKQTPDYSLYKVGSPN